MKTVGFHTLGCKLNFSETSTIARAFNEEGYQRVDFDEYANVYVINTCSVTDNADKECKRIVKQALKGNPDAYVVIVGCYAQLKPEEIAKIEGVDLVLGANEKFKITQYLQDLRKTEETKVLSCDINDIDTYTSAFSVGDRTRAFLKAQDGCDYTCAFCTIPLARGKSRSGTVENVVKSAETLATSGVKEVVLTGVNLGDFGKGNQVENKRKEETFFDLVKALDEVDGIERFRISSIEPNLLKDEIIEFVARSKRFVPHFHIPLQSGSDKILKSMRRRYLSNLYVSRVNKIKQEMPHCCIGVDVIVGFPGETHEDFLDTYNFLNELPISYLHVFTYSERDNTDAAVMTGIVPIKERQKRNQMLRILSEKKKHAFYQEHLGQTRRVLFEEEESHGHMHGFTDNYIKVKVPYNAELVNKLAPLSLVSINNDGLMCTHELVTSI